MAIKNIIFDIGGVLADSKSGNWFITPNFWKIINQDLVDETELQTSLKKNLCLQTQEPKTEEDEHKMFFHYYYQVLQDIHYPIITKEICDRLADDCVYNDEKFIFYKDVKGNLEKLSQKYNLYIISNGWPSSLRILKNQQLEKFFKEILISSMYSTTKEEKLFDLFLEKESTVSPQETLFIDDRRHILKKASQYGFHLLLMDRKKQYLESKFKSSNTMDDIWEVLK